MKTAVSIPDDVFRAAERLAKRQGVSRSELYTRALAALVAREDDDAVTVALDRVYGSEDQGRLDETLRRLPSRALSRDPW